MSLVRVFDPNSEAELAIVLCLLEAHGIPAFVQGGHFGALYPGPQIAFYNARRVLVPDSCAADAREALAELAAHAEHAQTSTLSALDKVRIVLETFLAGWFVPGHRRRPIEPAEADDTGFTDIDRDEPMPRPLQEGER
jgi:hypothetical protein